MRFCARGAIHRTTPCAVVSCKISTLTPPVRLGGTEVAPQFSTMANKKHMGSDADKTPRDANPDPITGAPGSHPVGTGLGAAGGAATGAAVGSLGGPIGAMVRGVAAAVVGLLVRKPLGETVAPTHT